MKPRTASPGRSRRPATDPVPHDAPTERPRPARPRPTARQWTVDFRRALRRHRRKLAVVVTVAAVLTGLTALAPPPAATVSVVTAARQLSAGTTIQASDLQLTELPPHAVPQGALTDPTDLIGEKAAGPVPERQVLTPTSLLRQRSAVRSLVVAPLPLADERVSGLLQAGDVVDVLAADTQTGKTRVVASAVHVLTGTITADATSGGGEGGLVLVEVSADTATALAAAAAVSALSIVWH